MSMVLLDTATEPTLEWTRYPFGPAANTPGLQSGQNTTVVTKRNKFDCNILLFLSLLTVTTNRHRRYKYSRYSRSTVSLVEYTVGTVEVLGYSQ
ncbi:hypothetical protein J6590_008467 [Homalodisca vitripennis]|nr:hypothetical protein J6590_008467 [Homalodisca vitripennis]